MAGFISEADAAVLLAARDVLKKLAGVALLEALPSRGLAVHEVLAHGRFMEACDQASQGVFEALNVAQSHLRDAVATRALAQGIVSGCDHRWARVAPVVHVVNDPTPDEGTYNAVCTRCDARAWLHWPTRKEAPK